MSQELNTCNQNSIETLLNNTLSQLNIARKIAVKETLHLDYEDRETIQNDYKTAIKLFEDLTNEIIQNGTFHSLESFINEKEDLECDLVRAERNTIETHGILKEYEVEAQENNLKNSEEIHLLNVQLGLLKDKYQDEIWEHGVKLRYSSDWLQAQSHQHQLKQIQSEQQLERQVEDLQRNLEDEHLVHDELEDFYSMKLGDYIQQLVYWVDKYEDDKKDYDENIETLKKEYTELLQKIETTKELYTSRQTEIAAYEEIKEKRRLEEIRLEKLNVNATKIQAWWRGMMVRCKLGPFKVKKPKAKGKSKKN